MLRPLLVLATALAVGCGRDHDKRPADEPTPLALTDDLGMTDAGKRWWIDKASRTLRLGVGATDGELAELAALPYDDIVARLMADPRFAETLVDFNYYYFGFKSDKLAWPDESLASVFGGSLLSVPQAIDGAERVLADQDILGMLGTERVYAQPFGPVFEYQTGKFIFAGATERRQQLYGKYLAALDAGIAYLEAPGDKLREEYCPKVQAFGSVNFSAGFSPGFDDALDLYEVPVFRDMRAICYSSTGPVPPEALDRVKAARQRMAELAAYYRDFEPDRYSLRRLADVRRLDTDRLGLKDKMEQRALGWFYGTLLNSSTNYNRKRANYVLKRFFCDDLTPVNVVLPGDHAGGRHGSDPGCQSCHYKLDPMAGFFRYRNGYGDDAKGVEQITFSDDAKKPMAEYLEEWRSRDPRRTWDVGYVRSTTDPSLNDYTDNPADPDVADLFALLQRAPEVRQCLIKRLATYVVGEQQTMDPGYLAEIIDRYQDERVAAPGAAFKRAFSTLVLSRTFRTQDPLSEECYDLPRGADAETRPPCKVAAILERQCAQCHRGAGAAGRLDLTRWQRQDGAYGFPHLDPGGAQRPRAATMQVIYDRLMATDPRLRMPLNKHMDVADRDALFLWVSQQLEGANHGL